MADGSLTQPGGLQTVRRSTNGSAPAEVLATSIGLRFPKSLTFERWQHAGEKLVRLIDTSAWCLGDWVVYGELRYKNRYRQAIEAAGLDYQTIRNYVWVARRFEMSRRRERLSFQHHAEVASLPPADQDVWLDRAESEGWSRNQLRQQLRALRKADQHGVTADLVSIPQIDVTTERIERWRAAAKLANTKFESWVLASLDAAAGEILHDASPEADAGSA